MVIMPQLNPPFSEYWDGFKIKTSFKYANNLEGFVNLEPDRMYEDNIEKTKTLKGITGETHYLMANIFKEGSKQILMQTLHFDGFEQLCSST